MKVELKKVEINNISIESRVYGGCSLFGGGAREVYKYTFELDRYINPIVFEEVGTPDSLKEFRESKGLSKDELTEWLNVNYK